MTDNITKDNIQSFSDNSDFFTFLFGMWCASRRCERIKNELFNCSVKVTKSIKNVLDEAIQNGIRSPYENQSKYQRFY